MWLKNVHNGEDGVLRDDDVHARVPSPPEVPGGAKLDFDIGALGEDSLAGNSNTLLAYLDKVYLYLRDPLLHSRTL